MRVALWTIGAVLALALLTLGPLLEPVVLAPALARSDAASIRDIGRLMQLTGRTERARELYEVQLCPLLCGDEAANPGLARLVEERYGGEPQPAQWARYLPWRPLDTRLKTAPGTPPNPLLGRVLLDLACIYEDRRDYAHMRHILHALRFSLEAGALAADEHLERELRAAFRRDVICPSPPQEPGFFWW